ncbi:UPF0488 protein C8orf33 homolog [Penaeus japonicus]|uniref:UPF0488 protein C8orf33 homolog n=1 Tax=Penaeus japonicus TaxID=27405 RepID=UPI001C70C728|nr:UPF0488 protein C8orf33 homolog [Penaeus japonicus]
MPPKPRHRVKKGPPPKVVTKPNAEEDKEEAAALEKFALELRWCLQQIELSIEKKQGSSKQTEELMRSHMTLSNNKASTVKKRQLMRSMFGDYRKKMAEEEKKFKIEKPTLKTKSTVPGQSKYVKKSTNKGDQQTVVDATESNSKEEAKESSNSESVVKENPELSPKPTDTFKFQPTGNEFRFNFPLSE